MQCFIAERPAHQPDCQTEPPSNHSPVCPFSQDDLCPPPQRPGENFECLWGETLNASLLHSSSPIHPSALWKAWELSLSVPHQYKPGSRRSWESRNDLSKALCRNMFKYNGDPGEAVCIIEEKGMPELFGGQNFSSLFLALPDSHYLLKGHYFTAYG